MIGTNNAHGRAETTLLYQIVQEYWPELQAELASHGRYLPAYIGQDVPVRFLFASQPAVMGKVLGIVYRAIATHLTRKAGYTNIVTPSRFQ